MVFHAADGTPVMILLGSVFVAILVEILSRGRWEDRPSIDHSPDTPLLHLHMGFSMPVLAHSGVILWEIHHGFHRTGSGVVKLMLYPDGLEKR